MRSLMLLTVFALQACKTVNGPDPETLKPAIEAFHRSARWRDFRGTADLIVPERRTAFIKARSASKDEKDLFITDYQLEDARLALTQKKYRSAATLYRRAAQQNPGSVEIKTGLGISLVMAELNFSEAIPLLNAGVKEDPNNADAWLALGLAYQNLSQDAKAKGPYQQYLRLRPTGSIADEVRSSLQAIP